MSYSPQIQPAPTTGDEELDRWLRRLVDTLNEYMVKDRQPGNGLQYDALDRLEVSFGFMQRNKV